MDKLDFATTGVVIVDHGSRRAESNDMLARVRDAFVAAHAEWRIVEHAHMELAEPSMAAAFAACVARGAQRVLVSPLFLAPGRHWARDIPALAARAAAPLGVPFLVAAPLGVHALLADLLHTRLARCVDAALGAAPACDVCARERRAKCALRCAATPADGNIELSVAPIELSVAPIELSVAPIELSVASAPPSATAAASGANQVGGAAASVAADAAAAFAASNGSGARGVAAIEDLAKS